MAQYIYTMNRVGKVVPPKRVILRDISLSFFPGAKIGVLGLNGSGKSTLLKIMGGIDTNFEGEARAQSGIKVGYLPQEPQLDPDKDVRSVVMEGLGGAFAQVARFNEISRQVRRAHGRRRDEQAARGTGQAAGRHRRGRRLGARAQARDRRRRAAPAAVGRHHQQALGWREAPRGAVPPAAVGARHVVVRRTHQPSRRRVDRVAREISRGVSVHRHRGDARSLLPRQRGRVDPRTRSRPRHSLQGQLLHLARAERRAARRGRANQRRPAQAARDGTRMGAHEPERPPRQEQGARRALRRTRLARIPGTQRDQRNLHSAGRAPRRSGHRSEEPAASRTATACSSTT